MLVHLKDVRMKHSVSSSPGSMRWPHVTRHTPRTGRLDGEARLRVRARLVIAIHVVCAHSAYVRTPCRVCALRNPCLVCALRVCAQMPHLYTTLGTLLFAVSFGMDLGERNGCVHAAFSLTLVSILFIAYVLLTFRLRHSRSKLALQECCAFLC